MEIAYKFLQKIGKKSFTQKGYEDLTPIFKTALDCVYTKNGDNYVSKVENPREHFKANYTPPVDSTIVELQKPPEPPTEQEDSEEEEPAKESEEFESELPPPPKKKRSFMESAIIRRLLSR